jgi:putative FmdB family regulatory protein
MPLYEYICDCCGKKFTALVGVVLTAVPTCPKCGGMNLTKLISRFSSPRSAEEAVDKLADMADPDDAASVRRLMNEMKGELGDEFGEDIDELMDEAEEGDAVQDMV